MNYRPLLIAWIVVGFAITLNAAGNPPRTQPRDRATHSSPTQITEPAPNSPGVRNPTGRTSFGPPPAAPTPPPIRFSATPYQVDDFVRSVWFALVTGLASVLGVVLTLYQLRVRHQPQSRLRVLEWKKLAMVAGGVGVLIFAAISFYLQDSPPGFLPFRSAYDALHGECGAHWNEGPYSFRAAAQTSEYTATVEWVAFLGDVTQISLHVHCNNTGRCTPFRDPGLQIGHSKVFTPLNRYFRASATAPSKLNGFLNFPELSGECGTLKLWIDMASSEDKDGRLATPPFRLTTDKRSTGTSIWGLLVVVGAVVIIAGTYYDPLVSIKRQLLSEGKDLRQQQEWELRAILHGRKYEDLSTDEKRRYDETCAYYARSRDVIFEMLSGAKLSSRSEQQ